MFKISYMIHFFSINVRLIKSSYHNTSEKKSCVYICFVHSASLFYTVPEQGNPPKYYSSLMTANHNNFSDVIDLLSAQQIHDVGMTSYWRRYDVITSYRRQCKVSSMSGTVRRNDVIMTSIRRHYIISTSAERHSDVKCLLGANEYNGQKLEKFPISISG